MTQYCPVCLKSEQTRYLRRGWRFSLEVVCSDDGCFLLDACWKCGALLDPLSVAVPCAEFVCCKCSAPLAKAPSLRLRETIQDQSRVYDELHRRVSDAAAGFAEYSLYELIQRLSAGKLRGTNPTNAAERHNTVMAEAWALRNGPADQARLAAAARRAARKAKIAGDKATKRTKPGTAPKPLRQSACKTALVNPATRQVAC
jgi:hypothetical protein